MGTTTAIMLRRALDAVGAPVLVLGPGNIAQAHTRDERLDRAALAKTVELYGAMLRIEN